MTFFFPDISEWQPNARVDDILDESGGFICIRAGFGVGYQDNYWPQRRDQATDARVLMIYHYVVKPGSYGSYEGTVAENADQFAMWIGHRRPNEVLIIDTEPGGGDWSATDIREYTQRVDNQVGSGPWMYYANEAYVGAHNLQGLYSEDTGWIAKWGSPGTDADPPIYDYIAWQHAADGYGDPRHRWPGCGPGADENRVDMPRDEFVRRLLGDHPNPPPSDTGSVADGEVADMPRWWQGELNAGTGVVTVISVHPGLKTIGFFAAATGKPVVLKVRVHDGQGSYYRTVTIDADNPKPTVSFRDPATTDGVIVTRWGWDDTAFVPVGWDAHA